MVLVSQTLWTFESLAIETVKLQQTLIMSGLLTLFMTIKRRQLFFTMRIAILSFMNFLITLLAEKLILFHTIPVRSIIQTLLTFICLRIPFLYFRCGLICIYIPVCNIELPNVLWDWFEEVLMVVDWHLLFAACEIHWVVLLSVSVKVFFGYRRRLVNGKKVFYCYFKQQHSVCFRIPQAILKLAFLIDSPAPKDAPLFSIRFIVIQLAFTILRHINCSIKLEKCLLSLYKALNCCIFLNR
jgi:hypothetical protein